jgi:hypothetical protein
MLTSKWPDSRGLIALNFRLGPTPSATFPTACTPPSQRTHTCSRRGGRHACALVCVPR